MLDKYLLNGSSGNRIDFANNGMAAPASGTRSAGTKICLRSNVDASNVDYAIGIETDNMWFSVPASAQGFNWYAGTTRIARLNGSGAFNAKSVSAESNLYSGGNINQVGALYVGTGGDFGNGRVNMTAAAASTKLCYFWTAVAGAQVGSISTDGTSTSYNTTSYYRLKEMSS